MPKIDFSAPDGAGFYWVPSWRPEAGGAPHKLDKQDAERFAKETGSPLLGFAWPGGSLCGPDGAGADPALFVPGSLLAGTGTAGEHIREACRRLAEASEIFNPSGAWTWFNGTISGLPRAQGQNCAGYASALQSEYSAACARNRAAWEQSAEGQKYKKEQEERQAGDLLQGAALDAAVEAALESGDFVGICKAVAEWASHDRHGRDLPKICALLAQAGFRPGEGVGDERVKSKSDPVLFCRYCIGQALDMGQRGAIHPMIGDWLREGASSPELLAAVEREGLDLKIPRAPVKRPKPI